MNKDTFKKGMALMVKAFPAKDFDYDTLWMFLNDIPDADFAKAIKDLVMTEKEINRATNIIAMIREKAMVQDRPTAEMAWGEVMDEVRRVGYSGAYRFSSPMIARAVSCIGWRNICMSECIGIERAHFFKAYDGLLKREVKMEITSQGQIPSNIEKMIEHVSLKLEARP